MVGLRLKEVREKLGMKQNELADKMEINKVYISRYEANKVDAPIALLQKYIDFFKINGDWLLTGKGSMFLEPLPQVPHPKSTVISLQSNQIVNKSDFWQIEVVSDISAGDPLQANQYEALDTIPIAKKLLPDISHSIAFIVNGDSMSPEIEHGDYVIINTNHYDYHLHYKIVAVREGNFITLKRMIIDESNKFALLVPNNIKHKPIALTEGIEIIGLLKLVFRKY
jgi:repressor LexA